MPPPNFFISFNHNFNTYKFVIKKDLSKMPAWSFLFDWDLLFRTLMRLLTQTTNLIEYFFLEMKFQIIWQV